MRDQGAETEGGWAYACALGAFVAALPLVLFGGSVTTLGAGMAVEGWLVAEGHFLLFFPVDAWFRDTATFVEHTHRLFGVLVGALAVLAAAGAWLTGRRTGARVLASAALLGVVVQGTVGGLRVLEASSGLAFLHGALAQAVLALLAASALRLSPAWRAPARVLPAADAPRLRRLAVLGTAVVFVQIVLGAWYRHGLRPVPAEESGLALALHLTGAFASLAVLLVLIGALYHAAERGSRGARREARVLGALLAIQLFLGLLAWAGHRPGAVGPLEWGLSIAHVLVGGLLLCQCTVLVQRASAALPVSGGRPRDRVALGTPAGEGTA